MPIISTNFVDGTNTASARPRWALVAAIVAVLFGILTVLSGGRALFGNDTARAAVGNAVAFVLWFNFVARSGIWIAIAIPASRTLGCLMPNKWSTPQ